MEDIWKKIKTTEELDIIYKYSAETVRRNVV